MRRIWFICLLFSCIPGSVISQGPVVPGASRAALVKAEKQPVADQQNGYYLNPVIAGNYGDPSLIRVEEDYYMAFSRGNGFILWHSRDLVNWRPVVRHTFKGDYSMIWAVDLQYFDGKFHLYMPINHFPGKNHSAFGNFVSIAENPEGPWSEPVNLEIPVPDTEGYAAIDPGLLMTPEGKKYLYVNHGYMVTLNREGTKATSSPEKVYDGWPIPEEWNVECMCLESPKFFYHHGFYYMVSAQGGTSGPSTAHMTVVARSVSPEGPWTNSPYNPLTRTYSVEEKWWHQGHGTIFEAADGTWWTVYHARLRDYPEIGRQTLLMPVEWTGDGWPVIKAGYPSGGLIPGPKGDDIGHGMVLSDNFSSDGLGIQWSAGKNHLPNIRSGDRKLVVNAVGNNHREGTSLSVGVVNTSFEVTVKIEIHGKSAWGGIALGNDGIMSNGVVSTFTEGPPWRMLGADIPVMDQGHIYLKIKNHRKDISFYCSDDGENWTGFGKGLRIHNSYHVRLFAWGKGQVIFSDFRYQGLE